MNRAGSMEGIARLCRMSRRALTCMSKRGAHPARAQSSETQASGLRHDSSSKALEVKRERQVAALNALRCNYCRRCGAPMEMAVPAGEEELRHVCSSPSCRYVDYHNPKMVVGCVVEHEGKVLLCRRALEPCRGLWTLPAGYMELAESTADGAIRETWEEAQARVEVVSPYAHLDIPVIGQAYILFRARLLPPFHFGAGPESLEVALFAPDEIPFSELAFSSVDVTLQHWVSDSRRGSFGVHHGVIRKKPGASPRDRNAFEYRDNFELAVQDDLM